MRLLAIVPLLLSIGAFVLLILVLFAGHDKGFRADTYIIKVWFVLVPRADIANSGFTD
jgi:hypothetical protein